MATQQGTAYRQDPNLVPIPGGSTIADILNESVDNSSWTAITVPSGLSCKSIAAALRDGTSWKMSHLSNGARYVTVEGSLSLDLAKTSGETIFYVQSVAASGTLEVLLID